MPHGVRQLSEIGAASAKFVAVPSESGGAKRDHRVDTGDWSGCLDVDGDVDVLHVCLPVLALRRTVTAGRPSAVVTAEPDQPHHLDIPPLPMTTTPSPIPAQAAHALVNSFFFSRYQRTVSANASRNVSPWMKV